MTLVEYAESIAPFPLSDFQKGLFEKYEQCLQQELTPYIVSHEGLGREFVFRVMEEWKKRNKLQEYRCSCGRLLGRFSGRAEIKCPKCGKMNAIGFPLAMDEFKLLEENEWFAKYQQEPLKSSE